MIKEIKFNGVTTVPSDYAAPDGDLAQATNMAIDSDGNLSPIGQPSEVKIGDSSITLADDETLAFIHKNTGYKHYIIIEGSSQSYTLEYIATESGDTEKRPVDANFSTVTIDQLAAVGNTLLCLTDDGMYYFLWKDSAYVNLGNHLPEINMEFALSGTYVRDGDTKQGMERIQVSVDTNIQPGQTLSEATSSLLTTGVMGAVAKFTGQLYDGNFYRSRDGGAIDINKGKFIYPFLVRYALCLYDETVTMQSAPVFMLTNSAPVSREGSQGERTELPHAGTPCVTWHEYDSRSSKNPSLVLEAWAYDLQYEIKNAIPEAWKDIITGINIYVSQPLYDVDMGGRITEIKRGSFLPSSGTQNVIDPNHATNEYHYIVVRDAKYYSGLMPAGYKRQYAAFPYKSAHGNYTPPSEGGVTPEDITADIYDPVFVLPKKENLKQDIEDCGTFYLLKHLNASEATVSQTFTTIDIPQGYLTSLVNKEVMPDDFGSHHTLKPTIAFSYNDRINITGITKELYKGYDANAMFQHTDVENTTYIRSIFYQLYVKRDGEDFVFNHTTGSSQAPLYMDSGWAPLYFYYPDPNAYKVIIDLEIYDSSQPDPSLASTYKRKRLNLKPHPTLNGAEWVGGVLEDWDDDVETHLQYWNQEVSPSPDELPQYKLPNVVYTSEVNNPFNFTSSGANTIGSGTILGLSTATKALSEGQFGQFPLYCFTDEGVWALEVQSDGFYRATHPVSRDVCNNKDSITQIDTAVLFTTERGIMLLSGSSTTCISTPLEDKAFVTTHLPGLVPPSSSSSSSHPLTNYPSITPVDFLTYLQGARMAYDYTHQRIYVFNATQPYCYIYNLKSKKWTMQANTFVSALNSYPNTEVVQNKNGTPTLVDIADEDFTITGYGMVITRPIKLDTTAMKTVNAIIMRGVFQKGNVKSILYGSRDIITWHLLGSSTDHYLRRLQGTPYQFFRLAIPVTLTEGESLYGCTIDFEPKYMNKIR